MLYQVYFKQINGKSYISTHYDGECEGDHDDAEGDDGDGDDDDDHDDYKTPNTVVEETKFKKPSSTNKQSTPIFGLKNR